MEAKSFDVLDGLEIAAPCQVSWQSMTGTDKKRFCGECQLNVYNLSAMTEAEARNFLANNPDGDRTCVRFYRRADGTVLTRNCPVGLKKLKDAAKRLARAVTAAFSFILSVNMVMAKPESHNSDKTTSRTIAGRIEKKDVAQPLTLNSPYIKEYTYKKSVRDLKTKLKICYPGGASQLRKPKHLKVQSQYKRELPHHRPTRTGWQQGGLPAYSHIRPQPVSIYTKGYQPAKMGKVVIRSPKSSK